MDIQEKKLIEETAALARENNRLLKKLRRAAVWGRVFHVLYWIIIIGVAIGAFYFLQPYVDGLLDIYGNIQNAQENFGNLFDFGNSPGNDVE